MIGPRALLAPMGPPLADEVAVARPLRLRRLQRLRHRGPRHADARPLGRTVRRGQRRRPAPGRHPASSPGRPTAAMRRCSARSTSRWPSRRRSSPSARAPPMAASSAARRTSSAASGEIVPVDVFVAGLPAAPRRILAGLLDAPRSSLRPAGRADGRSRRAQPGHAAPDPVGAATAVGRRRRADEPTERTDRSGGRRCTRWLMHEPTRRGDAPGGRARAARRGLAAGDGDDRAASRTAGCCSTTSSATSRLCHLALRVARDRGRIPAIDDGLPGAFMVENEMKELQGRARCSGLSIDYARPPLPRLRAVPEGWRSTSTAPGDGRGTVRGIDVHAAPEGELGR